MLASTGAGASISDSAGARGGFVEAWLLEMGLELTFEKGQMGRVRRKNKRLPRAGAVYKFFARVGAMMHFRGEALSLALLVFAGRFYWL